jgi:hypothetical protein
MLLVLISLSGIATGQSVLQGDYFFFSADSLSGFDMNRAYQELGTFNAIHKLNAQEKKQYMRTAQRRFIRSKYKIQDAAINETRDLFPLPPGASQPLSTGCNNLDFENGDYTGWSGKIGYNAASWTECC